MTTQKTTSESVLEAIKLSAQIEDLLVSCNLRGMKTVQASLRKGYCLRAAMMMHECDGHVLIGTGFPVADTFETDGPVGAISLYWAFEAVGARPIIVCGDPLASAIAEEFTVEKLPIGDVFISDRMAQAARILEKYQPQLVISIERPGQAEDASYYNMRGESIVVNSASFDEIIYEAGCPTIAIGDGGNEIGMGNVRPALRGLDIKPAVTRCNELIVADVSNWGGHALVAMMGWLSGKDLLADFDNRDVLSYLSERGSVDGVTRENTLTEDGLSVEYGDKMLHALRNLTGFKDK
ncbi:DUF4392 domain-containing protein [Marinomonas mediterranea]|uniref:DUF4392 domain-containing protein n=1 Tax=Marinomonas mediterranea TaxID=119864 RepID=UPI002349F44E|nr:DUF4392 domain-containing protein [Marinomonas mediterranea]WCN11587.1 DUF4392 domain-containing protein [Marinomonas mediterranea]